MEKQPRRRTAFRNADDELNYLNEVVSFWWYQRGDREKAAQFCGRLHDLLLPRGFEDGSIMLHDHWAVLFEVRGDPQQAIVHRQQEIAIVEKLFGLGGPVGPINEQFLAAKLVLLARLCRQVDRPIDAEQALRMASELAQAHGFLFNASKPLINGEVK